MIDEALLILLRCPVTGEPLEADGSEHLRNSSGSQHYPVVFGIPDFRLFDPPYMTRDEERECAYQIAEAGEHLCYQELIEHFERIIYPHVRPPGAIDKGIAHRKALLRRSPDRLDSLIELTGGCASPRGLTLDLGCGSGEATAALRNKGADSVIGLDISLVELMLARKLLAELGQAAHLVAGCAEALPFRDDQLDFVYSPDVIEHVSDQALYLREARRVLKPSGQLLLNSPNRYSVVCAEPHVGIWFLGFAPRALMDPLTRLAGKGGYQGKRLLSLHELRQLLRNAFPAHHIIFRHSNRSATSVAGRIFYLSRFISEPLFAHFCDQHVVYVSSYMEISNAE